MMVNFKCLIVLSLSLYTNIYSQNVSNKKIEDSLSVKNDYTKAVVFLDSTSFDNEEKFSEHWNMFYPWGTDHNGTARMYPKNVSIKKDGVLQMTAQWLEGNEEGKSTADPHLPIRFHSGAVHYKKHIKVTEKRPHWEISGDFKAPIAFGSWPAFWITGADSWPPEIDMLEFKGSDVCWQNTVTGKDWKNTIWTTEKSAIADADTTWHNYKVTLTRIDQTDTQVKMYIDGQLKSNEVKDFANKPFWLIINMQMEGASGTSNTDSEVRSAPQYFSARNIYVAATSAITD